LISAGVLLYELTTLPQSTCWGGDTQPLYDCGVLIFLLARLNVKFATAHNVSDLLRWL